MSLLLISNSYSAVLTRLGGHRSSAYIFWKISSVQPGIEPGRSWRGVKGANHYTIIISLPKFNLPVIGAFTWLTPSWPYRAMTCRERALNCGSIHGYFTTQGHWGPPRMRIRSMPGAPPRQHEQGRWYIPVTHPRRIWKDVYDSQVIFWHLSYRWRKTPKKFHPGNLCRPGIERGPAAWQARMHCLFHSGGLQ